MFRAEIVSYAIGDRITKNLVSQSLFRAVVAKRSLPLLIPHCDRGSLYCSHERRRLPDQFHMGSSISSKGECYDNAPMESSWGMLKSELVHHRRYATRQEAIGEIKKSSELFNKRQERHATLGCFSPAAYERQYYAALRIAA